MVEKGVLLPKRIIPILQEMIRWYKHGRKKEPHRRRGIGGAGGGSGIRRAYCKTDAGSAMTITCYLDEDATGEEITVNCTISGGGNLDEAEPRLTDGLEIQVRNDNGTWKPAGQIFQHREPCS